MTYPKLSMQEEPMYQAMITITTQMVLISSHNLL